MPGQIRAISKLFTRYGFPIGEISAIIPKVMEKVEFQEESLVFVCGFPLCLLIAV